MTATAFLCTAPAGVTSRSLALPLSAKNGTSPTLEAVRQRSRATSSSAGGKPCTAQSVWGSRRLFFGSRPNPSLSSKISRAFLTCNASAELAIASKTAPVPADSNAILDWVIRQPGTLGWIAAGVGIGFIAGIGGALIGLGGAFLIIPLVTGVLKFDQHEACGTALLAVVATAIMGGLTYYAKGNVLPMYSLLLTASALLTARLGAVVASRMDGSFLRRALGFWWMLAAFRIGAKAIRASSAVAASVTAASPLARASFATAGMLLRTCWQTAAALAGTGGVAGFLAGLLGIGGSTVTIPVLVSCGLRQQMAQGTALAAMVVPAGVGALTHWQAGHVRMDIAPGLLVGVIAGAKLGGTIACALPERIVKIIFSTVLLYIGSNMAGIRELVAARLRRPAARAAPVPVLLEDDDEEEAEVVHAAVTLPCDAPRRP